jgi:hypothetical protein
MSDNELHAVNQQRPRNERRPDPHDRALKILWVMRHSGYIRNFESTLRMLCDRGHHVHLAFQIAGTHSLLDATDVAGQLSDQYRRFSRGAIPVRDDAWGLMARELRLSLDYLRYLGPEYRDAPKLRARATREVSEALLNRTQRGLFSTRLGRALLSRWMRLLHRAIPCDVHIDAFLEANRPDVLIVTPLIEPGAPQAEYVRGARALGIPTVLCVASWDNLTNKGLIHGPPDLVTVWNEMMKREAVDLHGIAPHDVVVTGAQPFDHWFEWKPSRTREAFCRQVGLPADRRYVLYLCSSKFIAPEEVPFVRKWVEHIRHSGSRALREIGVLVRPHPQNADQWQDVSLSDSGSIAVWPPEGAAPADAKSRADYFDSIYHSAAVVGINTTAEIESAIVGRPVFSVMAPEFRDTQDGTLHFDHLRRVNGGLLHLAASLSEHLEQLDAAIRDPQPGDGRSRRFVESFVRPYGIGVPATPKLVEAIETRGQKSVRRAARAPLWGAIVRPMLARAGARLQREALLALETKAEKARRKKRTPDSGHETHSARAREASDPVHVESPSQ